MERVGPDSRADSRALALAVIAGLIFALAACGTGPGSSPTSASAAASPTFEMPGETAEDTTPPSLDPSLPGQSEVEGRGSIWDALPPSYPVFESASEADADAGPVSAAYAVANVDAAARDIAQFYLDALDEAGFGTGLDGPLEDGSYTVWSSNGYGCDSLVTILPRGDESLITVLFGTGCPFK
jgi:hypothetical protein